MTSQSNRLKTYYVDLDFFETRFSGVLASAAAAFPAFSAVGGDGRG